MSIIAGVSKPTKNALTVTSADDFIFHSNYNTLKYESAGTLTQTVNLANYYHTEPGGGFAPTTYYNYKSDTLSHGLSYTPYFAGYIIDVLDPISAGTNAVQAPFAFGDFVFFYYLSVYADSSNLYFISHFNTTNNTGNISFDYAYRIFKNDTGL